MDSSRPIEKDEILQTHWVDFGGSWMGLKAHRLGLQDLWKFLRPHKWLLQAPWVGLKGPSRHMIEGFLEILQARVPEVGQG